MYTFDKLQLRSFIETCTQVGVAAFLRENSPKKDGISQRKAYEIFGEARVKRWVRDGLVKGYRMGAAINSKKLYSRTELHTALAAEQAYTATLHRAGH